MITHVMPLAEINSAFDLMHEGESIRSVVTSSSDSKVRIPSRQLRYTRDGEPYVLPRRYVAPRGKTHAMERPPVAGLGRVRVYIDGHGRKCR